jgi:hypothetical protein
MEISEDPRLSSLASSTDRCLKLRAPEHRTPWSRDTGAGGLKSQLLTSASPLFLAAQMQICSTDYALDFRGIFDS